MCVRAGTTFVAWYWSLLCKSLKDLHFLPIKNGLMFGKESTAFGQSASFKVFWNFLIWWRIFAWIQQNQQIKEMEEIELKWQRERIKFPFVSAVFQFFINFMMLCWFTVVQLLLEVLLVFFFSIIFGHYTYWKVAAGSAPR